jgi:hypothetical protein
VTATGGPGAGKTALLTELAAMGYRLARGASPRPDLPAFGREMLRRDMTYEAEAPGDVQTNCSRDATATPAHTSRQSSSRVHAFHRLVDGVKAKPLSQKSH